MNSPVLGWINKRKLALLGSVVFAALSAWFAASLLDDHTAQGLRMSAGPDGTRRHTLATYLCDQATQNNLSINLKATAGSEDCLNQLKTGQLDVAIVSSGVVVPDDEDIVVLGAVQLEAVYLLVRKEMAEGGAIVEQLRGKRVNLGEKGSTEWLLTQELLAFVRLKLPSGSEAGDVIPTELTKANLSDKAHAILQASGAKKEALLQELPDCVVVVATMPSSIVHTLIEAADYRIVPIPAPRAFLADNLQDSHANKTVIHREYLERTVIPACSYFTTQGLPTADCETVGARLLVVSRKNVPARAVRPLMKTIFEGEFARRVQPTSPREIATSYAIHPGAVAYLDRNKPLAIKEAMEWFNKGLSIFGAFSAGALSLYGLLWRKRTRKPSDYFAEIRALDLLMHGAQTDPAQRLAAGELVPYLNERLSKLRQSLIEDICEGRIKGDQVVANILALLKDVRANITKLAAEATQPTERLLKPNRPTGMAA